MAVDRLAIARSEELPQSLDLATPAPSFGVLTTSSLPSHVIITELTGALRLNRVSFKHSGPHKLVCECRVVRTSPSTVKTGGGDSAPKLQRANSTLDALELLQWEMELCVLPHLGESPAAIGEAQSGRRTGRFTTSPRFAELC